MDNPRNLPFAMYDLAVYLPGGAVSLIIAKQIFSEFFSYRLPLSFGSEHDSSVAQVIVAVSWLAASYMVGHVASFASSYLIEKFVHNKIGYPSDIWIESEQLLETEQQRDAVFRKIFEQELAKKSSSWVASLISFMQLPAFGPLILVRFFKPLGFYTHKLPFGLMDKLKIKFSLLNCGVMWLRERAGKR